MPMDTQSPAALRSARKFHDPMVTARGERRAWVSPTGLATLWINTGTLCNITCRNCYIESSPCNDALVYITPAEVSAFLDEAALNGDTLREVGFTGGEPFMNPGLAVMLTDVLGRPGLTAIVLTNAMQPMWRHRGALLDLRDRFGADRLILRVSLDHHDPALHDEERGTGSFARSFDGLRWLAQQGLRVHVAGRLGFARRERRRCVPAMPRCSRRTAFPSPRMIPSPSCFSPKWTWRPRSRRSPRPAGRSWARRPRP